MSNWSLGQILKRCLRTFGFTVRRNLYTPTETLAGLASAHICTVLDCGANEGQFAKYIAQFFPDALIYCIEPIPEAYKALENWARIQGKNIVCLNYALGDFEGDAVMHHHTEHSVSSSMLSTTEHEEHLFPQTKSQVEVTVSVRTLDSIFASEMLQLKKKIFLKLDVQGFEDRVLRGASQLLEHVFACVLEVSVEKMYSGQADFRDLVQVMYERGFRYAGNLDQAYGNDGRVMYLDALFIRSDEEHANA